MKQESGFVMENVVIKEIGEDKKKVIVKTDIILQKMWAYEAIAPNGMVKMSVKERQEILEGWINKGFVLLKYLFPNYQKDTTRDKSRTQRGQQIIDGLKRTIVNKDLLLQFLSDQSTKPQLIEELLQFTPYKIANQKKRHKDKGNGKRDSARLGRIL